ncbi:hypothetical protein B0A55_01052 [Friedmanniomyces simplex]|uniref:Uncharacterized protein n=1 Tax=Friedmanniomyces simplex TaxID=329884 RepID=A0A4U0Y337_9PEZI|nr:hypothetical protein B0A55_01052 [Friedmanniomyces simplex]
MKVLQTTELLEMILGMLETKDIWTHRRTSPLWNATIAASPELRLHHFYYPQFTRPASTFRLLPLSMPGLVLELGEPIRLGQWISITMTREAARRISPEAKPSRRVRSRSIFEGLRGGLGGRQGEASDSWPAPAPKVDKPATAGNSTLQCSDLYVTQPPILGMQAFIVDPVPDNWDDDAPSKRLPAVAKLSCDAGITLDFLAETAESLLIAKKLEEIGASVMFKAIMSFSKPEPVPRKRGVARGVTRIG